MGNGRMSNGGQMRPLLSGGDLRQLGRQRSAEELQQAMVELEMDLRREGFELERRKLACEITLRAIAATEGIFPDAASFVEQAAEIDAFLTRGHTLPVDDDAAEVHFPMADRIEELRGNA